MANDALNVNPDNFSQWGITVRGSDWLWAAFAIMLLSDLIVIGWHFTVPRGQRLFHQISVIVLTTAAIAYFSMASNLGSTPVATEFSHMGYPAGVLRQIWYVRYIDWVITTPALLLELVLASGLPLSDIITLVFFDLVMIITGLVGALVASSYKWGYYAFGCFALFYIWWVLIGPARTTAAAIGPEYKRAFTSSAAILSFLWFLYPIAWGLADGGSVIHPDSEMIFYGILDVLAKPVFIFYHLFALSKLDLTALQLSSGKFTTTAAAVNAFDREKQRPMSSTTATDSHVAPGSGAKKGMFSRRGRYDAEPAAATTGNNTGAINTAVPGHPAAPNSPPAPPRTSEATVA